MENATKALIMAAGMLIGMIIAALFAYEFVIMANTANAQKEKKRLDRIREFNTQIEKYQTLDIYNNPKYLTADEVVQLHNYVIDWNEENQPEITINYENFPGSTVLSELKNEFNNGTRADLSGFLKQCLPKRDGDKIIYKKFILLIDEDKDYIKDASKGESELGRIENFKIKEVKLEENVTN